MAVVGIEGRKENSQNERPISALIIISTYRDLNILAISFRFLSMAGSVMELWLFEIYHLIVVE